MMGRLLEKALLYGYTPRDTLVLYPFSTLTSTARAPLCPAAGAPGRDYVDGTIIVKFRAGTTVGAQSALLALVDGGAAERPAYANFDLVQLPDGTDEEAAAARLAWIDRAPLRCVA